MLFFYTNNCVYIMTIIEVDSSKKIKQFLDFPRELYADDPNWVCPLDNDIEAVFDASKNNFHSHGKITRWILINEQNKVIGRIAAFINDKKAHKNDA